jgi:hypothetical protein
MERIEVLLAALASITRKEKSDDRFSKCILEVERNPYMSSDPNGP